VSKEPGVPVRAWLTHDQARSDRPEERLVKLGAELKTLESVFKQAVEVRMFVPSRSTAVSMSVD
jgi:hypothetical protein